MSPHITQAWINMAGRRSMAGMVLLAHKKSGEFPACMFSA
jgi:hypothetical protein